ncbi:MAG: alpha/beta fold hydrolase [Leptospiraceae bacterium]|nr:alpha/beta fold hydrolase [Leptospiraceae bacterium]
MRPVRTNWVFLRGLGRQSGHWFQFRQILENYGKTPFDGDLQFLDLPGSGLDCHGQSPSSIAGITDALREKAGMASYSSSPSEVQSMARGNRAGGARARPVPSSERNCLFAISLGGMVALDWLSRYRHDFDHAFIVNSSARGISPFYKRMAPSAAWKLLGGIFQGKLRGDVQSMEEAVFGVSCNVADHGEKVQHWVRLQKEHPMTLPNFLHQLRAALTFKPPEPGFKSPVFLVSRNDRLVSPQCSDDLYRRYGSSDAGYFVHPFAGHDLTSDDPEGTADFLARYIAISG